MLTVQCPFCHSWEEVCFKDDPIFAPEETMEVKCPTCHRTFIVLTEWYPVHFLQKPKPKRRSPHGVSKRITGRD